MRQPQELNASVGHVVRERQEHRRGQDLPGLHALQREAGEEAAPAERRVLEDHRAGAGDLAGHREALDQAQDDEQRRGQQADLVVGRQQADGHGREAHQEHADDQHRLAAVRVAPVAEDEGADRPRDVADAVGRERRDDGDRRVPDGKKICGKISDAAVA